MDLALEHLGGRLHSLPDGETGERRNWIIHIIESLRAHPDLEVSREGDWSDYDRTVTFKVRRGHGLAGSSLDFGHVAAVEAAWPVYEARRTQVEADGMAGKPVFQVGIPGDFDMALFTLGPVAGLRRRRAFTDATTDEIHQIFRAHGHEIVFQIEVPAELVFVSRFPPLLQPVAARWLGGGVANLARRAPAGARFGVHLCLGDMNHRALGRMRDVSPLVRLANAIVKAGPRGDRWSSSTPPWRRPTIPHPPMPSSTSPFATSACPPKPGSWRGWSTRTGPWRSSNNCWRSSTI